MNSISPKLEAICNLRESQRLVEPSVAAEIDHPGGRIEPQVELPDAQRGGLRLRVLQGGSVGYFRDRKAAVIVYALRLHTVTLLEVRAGDLPWPSGPSEVRAASDRRFNAFFWRGVDLGYALVSDTDAKELGAIAREIAARK